MKKPRLLRNIVHLSRNVIFVRINFVAKSCDLFEEMSDSLTLCNYCSSIRPIFSINNVVSSTSLFRAY